MAIKDFTTSENNDSKKEERLTSAQPGQIRGEGNKPASTEIKNASATGDGSFGRSDELPDNEEEIKDNTY